MAGPLSGIRVLDFTWVLAGPYSTMILADLGADVIKVERMNQTLEERGPGPYVAGVSTYFFSINRGKRSLALDLKTPGGMDIIRRLAAESDVLTENYRKGALDKLGLGYEALRKVNPGLIYCSISGYGRSGPYADKGGFDLIAQGASGIMAVTGEPGGALWLIQPLIARGTQRNLHVAFPRLKRLLETGSPEERRNGAGP